jgi:hypothetical protein
MEMLKGVKMMKTYTKHLSLNSTFLGVQARYAERKHEGVVNGLGDGMPWPQPLIQWEMSNQARWAVLQAFNLLKQH